jgi:hypothetical protein
MLFTAMLIPNIAHAENTCTGTLSGPRQGKHTAADASAESVLWPPNHKMRTVSLSATNEDGDACDVTITDVRQDEAVDAKGSGNTSPDAANCSNAGNASHVDLRGERSGKATEEEEKGAGDGRYYHVLYKMNDPDSDDGDETIHDAKVLVPHDQGAKKIWEDQGPLFASSGGATTSCSA